MLVLLAEEGASVVVGLEGVQRERLTGWCADDS